MRLSPATLIIMIVFVLVAIIGVVVLRDYLKEETAAAPPAPREWAIAISDLEPGRVLTKSDIGFITEPELVRRVVTMATAEAGDGPLDLPSYIIAETDEDGNTRHIFNPPLDTIRSETFLEGRRVKEQVPAGMPYRASMLYPEGYRPSLVNEVGPGRGVYTVAITEFNPRDQDITNLRADVMFRNRPRNDVPGFENIPEQTVVLVEDARILEAGQPYVPGSSNGNPESGIGGGDARLLTDVTLAVARDDGAKLMTAQNNGDLSLVLYSADADRGTEIGTEQNVQSSVKLTDIVQATPTPAPEIEIEPYDTTIFRGTSGFSNNSFSFSDLLRELQEVGAIEIKMDPKNDDLAAHPATLTVPLNQPSNQGGGAGANTLSPTLNSQAGAVVEPPSGVQAVSPTLPGGTTGGTSGSGGSGGGGGG